MSSRDYQGLSYSQILYRLSFFNFFRFYLFMWAFRSQYIFSNLNATYKLLLIIQGFSMEKEIISNEQSKLKDNYQEVPQKNSQLQEVKKPKALQINALEMSKKYKLLVDEILNENQQLRSRAKGTNIPKFLLKIFFNDLPNFENKHHNERLLKFFSAMGSSKTRFDLHSLFGPTNNKRLGIENELNRRVLRRILNKNYDNILANKHIVNKRLYLVFCKKIMLRLSYPNLIDRLQI